MQEGRFSKGYIELARSLAEATGRRLVREDGPAAGDLVTVHSSMDPEVVFDLRVTASAGPESWTCVLLGIERDATSLVAFDGLELGEELTVSRAEIAGIIRCGGIH
ncbi:hypothetical protein CS8_058020 [Cupriavidus sp. 8B]